MDDGSGFRTFFSEDVDVGHHIVPGEAFLVRGSFEVDIVDVALHLGDLLVRDVQSQLLENKITL